VWRFALEKLEAHADHAALRERHLAAYLEFGARAEKALVGPEVARQIEELAAEEENLLAALEFSARAVDGAHRGLQLVISVQRFWSLSGRFALGRRALEAALGREGAAAPTPERAWALVRAAGFALMLGDHEAARRRLEESLAYWRAQAEPGGVPPAVLAGLGVVAMYQSRFEDALALGEESLALYRERGMSRGVAMALHNLGTIESALERPDHGRVRFEEALTLLRETGDWTTEALCLTGLAWALIRGGEIAGARLRLRECFAVLERIDTPRERFSALESLGELAMAMGRSAAAARLIGAASAVRDQIGTLRMPSEQAEIERLVVRIERDLGTAECARMTAAGRAATPESLRAEVAALLEDDPE
jgi:tetratricopeptide (TPR) repeat protein